MNEPHATITLEQYDEFKKQEDELSYVKRQLHEKEQEVFGLAKLSISLAQNVSNSVDVRNIFEKHEFDFKKFLDHYE